MGDTSKQPARRKQEKRLDLAAIKGVDVSGAVQEVEGGARLPNGSSVKPAYKHRTISYYPVTDDELDQIAAFNRVSATLFAAGSFILGWSLDVGKDLFFATDIEPSARNAAASAAVAGAVLAAVFFCVGAYFWNAKNKQSRRIKTESVDDL